MKLNFAIRETNIKLKFEIRETYMKLNFKNREIYMILNFKIRETSHQSLTHLTNHSDILQITEKSYKSQTSCKSQRRLTIHRCLTNHRDVLKIRETSYKSEPSPSPTEELSLLLDSDLVSPLPPPIG